MLRPTAYFSFPNGPHFTPTCPQSVSRTSLRAGVHDNTALMFPWSRRGGGGGYYRRALRLGPGPRQPTSGLASSCLEEDFGPGCPPLPAPPTIRVSAIAHRAAGGQGHESQTNSLRPAQPSTAQDSAVLTRHRARHRMTHPSTAPTLPRAARARLCPCPAWPSPVRPAQRPGQSSVSRHTPREAGPIATSGGREGLVQALSGCTVDKATLRVTAW